ncbi:MAG: hypothetical protein FJ290_04435 [Planctomycetes bacterium]|nr:hypothetical protein [Planctomycetota bacterium]
MPPNRPFRRGQSGQRGASAPRPVASKSSDSALGPPPAGSVDPLVGREIGGHKILQRVATGRLCSTYKANHTAMNRIVAFKALNPDADEATVAKFQQTARHSAQLHHPNIASIYDVNSDGGLHFCTLELVEGQTITDLLHSRQRMASADAVRLAIDVAEALRFANSRNVPGWRLSANRVVISKRGEVKILPPTFSPPGAPVLDDRYVAVATGVLLYALLSGGKVRDLEWALEPGSSAPKQLERLRSAAPGVRRDTAEVVERLAGIAGEPFANADAALHSLRSLLASKEQVESRTRTMADSARARVQRTQTGLYVAIGSIAFVALAIVGYFLARSCREQHAKGGLAEATAAAQACLEDFKKAQARFLAAPDEALAKDAAGLLEKARAAFAAVAEDYPDHPEGKTADATARSLAEQVQKFRDLAAQELGFGPAKHRIEEVNKTLEAECARRRDSGGQLDPAAWRERYLAVAKEFHDNAKAVETIKFLLAGLPRKLEREQMKIDSFAVTREVTDQDLPNLRFGKAIDAWNNYLAKYRRPEISDAVRKEVTEEHASWMTKIRQAARLKWGELSQQATYHIGKQEHDKARAIYNRVADNFGIAEYVQNAKSALAKLPKQ